MANWRLRMPGTGSNQSAPLSRAATEQAEFTAFLENVVKAAYEEISTRVEEQGRTTEIHMAISGCSSSEGCGWHTCPPTRENLRDEAASSSALAWPWFCEMIVE